MDVKGNFLTFLIILDKMIHKEPDRDEGEDEETSLEHPADLRLILVKPWKPNERSWSSVAEDEGEASWERRARGVSVRRVRDGLSTGTAALTFNWMLGVHR